MGVDTLFCLRNMGNREEKMKIVLSILIAVLAIIGVMNILSWVLGKLIEKILR